VEKFSGLLSVRFVDTGAEVSSTVGYCKCSEIINSANNNMIPREETELVSTKKDDVHGSDEEDDLDNSMIMVIMKMYKSNNFYNIKQWIVQWTGGKGKSWVFFQLHWIME
jgi:hypothetical protein